MLDYHDKTKHKTVYIKEVSVYEMAVVLYFRSTEQASEAMHLYTDRQTTGKYELLPD